jgi:hypothetical protein
MGNYTSRCVSAMKSYFSTVKALIQFTELASLIFIASRTKEQPDQAYRTKQTNLWITEKKDPNDEYCPKYG